MTTAWQELLRRATVGIATAGLWYASVGLAAEPFAAEPIIDQAQQLVGRWESFSVFSTNDVFDRATNVSLNVRLTLTGHSPTTEAELRITDAAGRQDPSLQLDGPIRASGSMIVIGSAGRVSFPYHLTNGVLTFECPVRSNNVGLVSGFKVEFRRMDSAPGGHHR